MSTTLTVHRVSTFPRVNLLPPEIDEKRRFRRVQVGLGTALTGAVAVVGLLYAGAAGDVEDAQRALDETNAVNAQLQTEAAKYASVPTVLAQLDAAKSRVDMATAAEIKWSRFLNHLSVNIPDKLWVTRISATQADATVPASDAAATNPLGVSGIGQITFEGDAMEHRDVATWLEYLADKSGYAGPYLTSSTEQDRGDEKVAHFTSTVTVTEDALATAQDGD